MMLLFLFVVYTVLFTSCLPSVKVSGFIPQHYQKKDHHYLRIAHDGPNSLLQLQRLYNSNNSDDEEEEVENKEGGCPFSMRFPRYKISLTRGNDPRESKDSSSSSSPSFFSRMMSNSLKSKIQSDYSKQQKQGQQSESFSFMWIKSPIQDEEETLKDFEENNDLYQQQFGNSKKIIDFNLNDILKSNPKKNMMKKNDKLSMSDLKEATNNVHAVYNFWRIAASFDDDVDNNYNDENRKVIVAAFPDASFQTIRGLCEIIEWRNDNISIFSPSSTNNNASSESTVSDQRKRIVHAVMDQTSPIPVVVFTKETNDITPRNDNNNNYSNNAESKTSIKYNHDVVTKRTQSWVKRILVNHQICPFTKSVTKSGQGLMADFGVPIGRIAYHTSSASAGSASASTKNAGGELILMADTFEAIYEMLFKGPSSVSSSSSTARDGISSILLSAPGYDDSFSLWSGPIFTMLESIVTSTSNAQKFIGVVCFHPYYKIPDENSQFPGFGQM